MGVGVRLGQMERTHEELQEAGSIVVDSPDTVIKKLTEILDSAAPGHLICYGKEGDILNSAGFPFMGIRLLNFQTEGDSQPNRPVRKQLLHSVSEFLSCLLSSDIHRDTRRFPVPAQVASGTWTGRPAPSVVSAQGTL